MSIATSMNLSMANIANEVVVNHKTPRMTKNHIAFKEIVFYKKRKPKTLRKVPGGSQILMLGKSIRRDN